MGVKTHTKKDQGPGLKNRTGIFAALIVVTLAAAAGLWQASQNQPDGSESSHLLADFTAFWGWGDREFAEGAQQAGWTFRWDGEAAADTANRLAERLHIVMSPISSPLGEAYQGSIGGGTDNPAVTIWYQEQADRQKNPSEGASIQEDGNAPVQLIILLQPDKGSKLDIIKASAAEIEEMAVEEEVPLKGSFTVRAMPAAGASAKAFARLAAAKQIESYDDGNTRSVTYLSPKLRSEIMSGTQSVNMQIAQVHSMSGDEGELVIGVPLITGDYSAGN